MSSRSFRTLAEAVAFLASRLEADDLEAIADQCGAAARDVEREAAGVGSPRDHRLRAIEQLALRHAARDLRSRYRFRRFPWRARAFALGGHGKELGHVHVDFVKDASSWRLEEIWVCR